MTNDFILTMPTPERAQAFAVKAEGMSKRIGLWLSGIAFGLNAVDSAIYASVVAQSDSQIIFRTDSWPLMGTIMEHLESEGITMIVLH